jgi:hypothetical protein
MLLVGDQRSGRDDSSATPAPRGPRNCGHSAGPAARPMLMQAAQTKNAMARFRIESLNVN